MFQPFRTFGAFNAFYCVPCCRTFTLREIAGSAGSCVRGKFNKYLNCQFFTFRFLTELGLQREARTMNVVSRHLYDRKSARRYFEMDTFADEGTVGVLGCILVVS